MNGLHLSEGASEPTTRPLNIRVRLHFALRAVPILALALGACRQRTIELPPIHDVAFSFVDGVELGMTPVDVARLGRSLQPSPDGGLRESYSGGWITYGFGTGLDGRLSSMRWWVPYPDSMALRRRWGQLVVRMRDAYHADPACLVRSSSTFKELRATWPGTPSSGVSSQIISSGDPKGYRAELVILVAADSVALRGGLGPASRDSGACEIATSR